MKFRLIASSDTHGQVMPIRYSDNKPVNHGFLKMLSTMENYINENTIVIDNGDTIEGSPFTTYCNENISDVCPMDECLNTIYDYINIGNHDFNYGQDKLLKYINDFHGLCICGNVKYKGNRLGKEYVIHNFANGERIALIGCVTQFVVHFEKEANLTDIEIEDCYEFCKRTIDKIKKEEKVEAIVIVYHGGFEKDFEGNETETQTGENEGYKICENLDFDIMISGHQHLSIAGKCCGKYVSQTLNNASEFALIDYDTDNKEGSVKLIKSDAEINQKYIGSVNEIENNVQKWLDKTIGFIDNYDLEIKDDFEARLNKHPLVSFLNEIQREYANADLSGCALFNDVTGFKKNITMRDLVSTYVYPNSLVKLEINGSNLKKYLEKNAEYFSIENNTIVVNHYYWELKKRHYNYDMIDGIDYTIKVSNPVGERIIDLKYRGKEINDGDLFTIVVNNYRYGGAGGFEFMKSLKVIKIYDEDMVTIIANYLKNHKEITINHKENIKVIM